MNCWRVQNLIAPFLDDELPEAERSAVHDHLGECVECRDLVEAVDQLPQFARLPVDPEVEERLFDGFEAALRERIEASLSEDDEPEELRRVANGGFVAAFARGEVRVPAVLVAAYMGVVVLLGGGIALNYSRVADLEASVQERDAIISAMNVQLQAAQQGELPMLANSAASDPGIIFMPPAAIGATGLPTARPLPGVMQTSLQTGSAVVPVNYRRAVEAPRAVH
jgi:anti-sigma factor RsiW